VLEISAGDARAEVDELRGGRLQRLEARGFGLLVAPETDERNHGAFPMAPWAGRVRDGVFSFDGVEHRLPRNKPPHAIHGTVRDRRWTVESATTTEVVISTALADPWPFAGRVVQRFALEPDALHLTMEVHAQAQPMPASCGWHPWWSRSLHDGGAVELELHTDAMYKRDDAGIPTGELAAVTPPPWDDCFTDLGQPAAVLRWPGAIAVTIETDCACMVVFTEPEHAVCVEPQSGPPDELNLAPHVVTPDAALLVRSTWRWAPDEDRA
jgi:galactose mutarotase-like enzyme